VAPAAIFHGTVDIAFTSPGPPLLQTVLGAEVTILALGVILLTDPQTLRRKRYRLSR